MKYYLNILGFFLFSTISQGQSFIFNQFFQPSLRINTVYSHDFNFLNKDRLHVGQADINCIIPIKSQLKLKVDLNKLLTLKLKKVAKLKVYQLFWNFRPRMLYLDLDYKDKNLENPFQKKAHFAYGFSTGLSGIHLLAKPLKHPDLLFYSVNISMMEDLESLQLTPIPSVTAMIGFAHIRNFNFYWYYGLFFSYNNGQALPIPFFGIQAKLTKNVWVNITLPVQIRFSVKLSKKFKLDFSAGLSSFSTAFGYQNPINNQWQRSIFGDLRVRAALTANLKLSPQAKLYIEAGCYAYQFPVFRWGRTRFKMPDLSPSVYGSLSLFYSFKKSLLGSTIDGIILF